MDAAKEDAAPVEGRGVRDRAKPIAKKALEEPEGIKDPERHLGVGVVTDERGSLNICPGGRRYHEIRRRSAGRIGLGDAQMADGRRHRRDARERPVRNHEITLESDEQWVAVRQLRPQPDAMIGRQQIDP